RAGGDAHRDFRPEDLCLAVALPPVGEQLGAERSNVLWSEVHFLCSPDKPPAPRGRRAPTGNRRYWGLVVQLSGSAREQLAGVLDPHFEDDEVVGVERSGRNE